MQSCAGNLDELLKDISPDLDPVLVDGVEEIKVMIKVDDGAELTCHFYNQVYNFRAPRKIDVALNRGSV